jgi:hypothetical protein
LSRFKALRPWSVLLLPALVLAADAVSAQSQSPFHKLAGRWVGEGRLGVKDGKHEAVKCRVTYFVDDAADELKQTIRCASTGGSIEVQSRIEHKGGTLKGSWKELVRNMNGDVSGTVTPTGFRVAVKGDNLSAHMDLIVKDARQIIEIQFHDSALIGLTLVLTKG